MVCDQRDPSWGCICSQLNVVIVQLTDSVEAMDMFYRRQRLEVYIKVLMKRGPNGNYVREENEKRVV